MLLAAGKKTKEICVCVSINIHIHTSISIYFLSHKFIPISSIPTRHQQVYPSPPLFHIYNSSNTKKPGSHFPQHTYLLNPSTENCFRIADPCLCDKIKINEKPSRQSSMFVQVLFVLILRTQSKYQVSKLLIFFPPFSVVVLTH